MRRKSFVFIVMMLITVAAAGCGKKENPTEPAPVPTATPLPTYEVHYETVGDGIDGTGFFLRFCDSITYLSEGGTVNTLTGFSAGWGSNGTETMHQGQVAKLTVHYNSPLASYYQTNAPNTKLTLNIYKDGVLWITGTFTPSDSTPEFTVQGTL